jgi:O-antigen ligase
MTVSPPAILSRPPGQWAERLLVLGLYGLTGALLLGKAQFELAQYLVVLAVAGIFCARAAHFRFSRPVRITLALGLALLIQGWAMATGPIAGRFHHALGWALVLAAAVPLTPPRLTAGLGHPAAIGVLLVLFVVIQGTLQALCLNRIWQPATSESIALFRNIHYLGLYSAGTIPILYWLSCEHRPRWRWLWMAALAGDFWLLMQTHSRPGYLALVAAGLVAIPFQQSRLRLPALAAAVGLPLLLYGSGLFGFAARIDDFFAHLAEEERAVVWTETWNLQRTSSTLQWLFGHGIGQFFQDFQAVSSFHREAHQDFASPHNFILDLLYSHGILGVLLFLAGYAGLYAALAAAIRRAQDPGRRRVGILLVCVTTAHLVLGFFTIPFFARHNILPLGLIVGADLWALLWMARRDRSRAA